MKYNSFNEQMERDAQDGTEFRYGAITTDLAAVPVEARLPYSPKGVRQYTSVFDSFGCASRAPLNVLETKLTYFYDHGMHPVLRTWLVQNGYLTDGRVTLSDNYIEILSGTSETGNGLKQPVDAIYRYGVIPASFLPLEEGLTREQYMNPARITQEMRDLGKQFLLRFGIGYEKVERDEMTDALEDDLLSVAVHAWEEPVNGVYSSSSNAFNHAIAKVDNSIYILDSYEPFTKLLAKDYRFFDHGYSLSITRQTPDPQAEMISLYQQLVKVLQKILSIMRV